MLFDKHSRPANVLKIWWMKRHIFIGKHASEYNILMLSVKVCGKRVVMPSDILGINKGSATVFKHKEIKRVIQTKTQKCELIIDIAKQIKGMY